MKLFYTAIAVLLPVATSFSPASISSRTVATSTTAVHAENGVNGSAEKKKVIILGGDGFCGWPTSLYLSDQGHDVVIVDNLSRRKIDLDLGCDSLTPISSPEVSVIYIYIYIYILPFYAVRLPTECSRRKEENISLSLGSGVCIIYLIS